MANSEDNKTAKIIKFDLHIHSYKSIYKEAPNVVDNSTKENLRILFDKLNENEVSLFSITDHNRFDAELYEEIERIIKLNEYPNVKNILAGIEFDVKLEEDMKDCHIICIFNAKNSIAAYLHIEKCINEKPLMKKDEFYLKKDFENLLENIGMDTILIASQRKDISNHNGKNASLSDSTLNVEDVIKIGYIDALEFQKPNVEGILNSNLKDLPHNILLISGSDCHDWRYYPNHDGINGNPNFHHSKSKMMPTFKGLLMTISSPELRLNSIENSNISYIRSIEIGNKTIELVNGVNAIIGENGSGKSTLLQQISGKESKKDYIVKIVKENNIKSIKEGNPILKFISQGEIIINFNKGSLFDTNCYPDIDTSEFTDLYSKYSRELKQYIEYSINNEKVLSELYKNEIKFEKYNLDKTHYIQIDSEMKPIENNHGSKLKIIDGLITTIESLLGDVYFSEDFQKLNDILNNLSEIKDKIKIKNDAIEIKIKVQSIVTSCSIDYMLKVYPLSTSKDKDITNYECKKSNFIFKIVEALKSKNKIVSWPELPKKVNGTSSKTVKGFQFNVEANYDKKDMGKGFYSKMFVKKYQNEESLKKINTLEEFSEAVMICTDVSNIDDCWNANFQKFIEESTNFIRYIKDEGSSSGIGNTLGEMSLAYYKYFTQDNKSWDVILIDQPEDNISNNNISLKLINYFQSLRNKKQLIFVTHSPLMVVNMDVDNVVFLKKINGTITAVNGCLEYEDNDVNILGIIAENMDGGRETIEKRLRVYGKKY
ncbi:MAG: hypothetical protein KRP56_03805 [Candidatus Methanogranum gryphiswaldense]|nr:MAG: hypothetical protein KRP56_03805 [Candidatus Methanogranum sp. U3.2.1]